MNFFRSKEDVQNWSGFKPGTDSGFLELSAAMAIVSTPRHQDRLSGRYVSSVPDLAPQFLQNLLDVTNNDPYWDPRPK